MIFFLLDEEDVTILQRYEILLNLAHALVGRTDALEDFASEFTISDLIGAYPNILECYMESTSPKVEDKTEKKVTTRKMTTPLYLLRCKQVGVFLCRFKGNTYVHCSRKFY